MALSKVGKLQVCLKYSLEFIIKSFGVNTEASDCDYSAYILFKTARCSFSPDNGEVEISLPV